MYISVFALEIQKERKSLKKKFWYNDVVVVPFLAPLIFVDVVVLRGQRHANKSK